MRVLLMMLILASTGAMAKEKIPKDEKPFIPIRLQGTANYSPERITPHGTDPSAASNTRLEAVEKNERVQADGIQLDSIGPSAE